MVYLRTSFGSEPARPATDLASGPAEDRQRDAGDGEHDADRVQHRDADDETDDELDDTQDDHGGEAPFPDEPPPRGGGGSLLSPGTRYRAGQTRVRTRTSDTQILRYRLLCCVFLLLFSLL